MEIIHDFGGTGIKKKGDADNFLLTNGIGGYASLSGKNTSKFQGVYFAEGSEIYKAIENIIIDGDVTILRNKLSSVARVRGDTGEFFYMPTNLNAFVYELSRQKTINLVLDCRKQLDFDKWGRYYRIYQKKDLLLVKYTKRVHPGEDKKTSEYEIYIAIAPDNLDYEKVGIWKKVSYEFDKRRNDEYELYVYNALKINASKIVFGFGTTEEKAIENLSHTLVLKFEEPPHVKVKFILDNSVNMAYLCSQQSLHKLLTKFNNREGFFAGLPWFNQFWSRDELVIVGALISLKEYDLAKDILMRYIGLIQEDGRLPNRDPPTKIGNADSAGWLFKRTYDLLKLLYEKKKLRKYFSSKELHQIKHGLEKSIHGIIKNYSEQELIINKAQETWCDTKITGRDGARIEIQAMQLNMYKFLGWLCSLFRDKAGKKYAEHKENALLDAVREKFWNGHYLKDGENDSTIRPNIFLAYYIYPELLSQKEWRKCFDNVLPRLFTGFGLSSVDMHSSDFKPFHTGMNDESYHNGDSWYWINNIAAICLYRAGKFRYAKYIHNILKGSTNDILWMGVPGCASEISSATKQESFGCFNQAWSNATYIEMIEEMF